VEVGINTHSGVEWFSCKTGKLDYLGCEITHENYAALEGKEATAWWFEQPVYFASVQRRVMRLVVDGKELIRYEKARERAETNRRNLLGGLLLWSLLLSGFVLVWEKFVHVMNGNPPFQEKPPPAKPSLTEEKGPQVSGGGPCNTKVTLRARFNRWRNRWQ
jgi:hypothetical protein